MTVRTIYRSKKTSQYEIQDLLRSALTAELVTPSKEIWLLSPWLSNPTIFDNRTNLYRGLDPEWERCEIDLIETLLTLSRRSTQIYLLTKDDQFNLSGLERLGVLSNHSIDRSSFYKNIKHKFNNKLHTKGIVSDHFSWIGSMNFTNNGVYNNEETIYYSVDSDTISQTRLNFRRNWELS